MCQVDKDPTYCLQGQLNHWDYYDYDDITVTDDYDTDYYDLWAALETRPHTN